VSVQKWSVKIDKNRISNGYVWTIRYTYDTILAHTPTDSYIIRKDKSTSPNGRQ
jgi:hypothetical protein